MDRRKIKILMLAAEASPLVKVGGLGDVVGALPAALGALGVDTRIMLPFYGLVSPRKQKISKVFSFEVAEGGRKEKASLWRTVLPGSRTTVYLVKHPYFRGKEIYAGGRLAKGKKYTRGQDDIRRFAFFDKAAVAALEKLDFKPDILHFHDWHTALVPDYLKRSGIRIKTVFTIHNLANQGLMDGRFFKRENLAVLSGFPPQISQDFMARGVLNSDFITTVSPTYAREILTPEQGVGLEGVLAARRKDLRGILNGLDTDFFDPANDPFLKKKFSAPDLGSKRDNKLELQRRFGLPRDARVAVVSLVSRLVWQKGLELITDDFADLDCQFIFLGAGEKEYENRLKKLAKKYPDKVAARFGFDEGLAHKIYAGSDIFLMPSRFEPCGLGQMIAMRYGTVPVVRSTGGLADTVDRKTGFAFKEFRAKALYHALATAIDSFYHRPRLWKGLRAAGMRKDFSWTESAKIYLKLYQKLIRNGRFH